MNDDAAPPGAPSQLPLFGGHPAARPAVGPAGDRVAPWPAVKAATTLDGATAAFHEHLLRAGKTENTRLSFASDLRLLAQFLGHGRPIGQIEVHDLQRFLTWLLEHRGEPCSAKSFARRVTTLKVFFAWLAADGARADDPALPLVHRRAVAPLPLVLTDTQVDALLGTAAAIRGRDQAPDPRPELLVRLLLDTGLKKGELIRLKSADVQADPAAPSVLVRYDAPRFRAKERRVPFDAVLLPLIEAYRRRYNVGDDAPLFACTARNLEYVLEDLVRDAALPERTSFETLRWTMALRAWRAGVPPEALSARLGLSPITWAETAQKLGLLAAGVGPASGVSERFPPA
ncbi:MAG: site-specific integrase [Ardenticatenales bacterium]|nr:site-specific integrase [Ardenticatenales bacterium]